MARKLFRGHNLRQLAASEELICFGLFFNPVTQE